MTWLQTPPKNIIVRMPNWLGDLVMATPVLADLRGSFPNARITAMCQSNVAALLEHDPHLDEIYSYKRPNGWLHHVHHVEIIQPLRQGGYDLGVLLTNSFSSAWWFYRGAVKHRLGYGTHCRSWLLNKAVPFPVQKETQHLVITYKMLLEPLGVPLSTTPPALYLSDAEKNTASDLLTKQGVEWGKNIIIGMNPGAAYGSAKCWLPERFVALSKRLLENRNIKIVYFGDPAGASLVNDICKQLPEGVINLAGRTTIREAAALIDKCSIFLTNDSGPMHISAALGTPLVALFGSTSDVKTGPYGSGKVIHKHVECSPCYKRVCPIDFRCMKQISVEEVYETLLKEASK